MRRVSWASKLFSFRLRIRGDNDHETPQNVHVETDVAETLERWIAERPAGMSATTRLNQIIVWLVLEAQEKNATPDKTGSEFEGLGRLINRRFDSLTRRFDEKTSEVLRAIVQNPVAMATMNEAHQRHEKGQAMDEDFLNNLLSDFDR